MRPRCCDCRTLAQLIAPPDCQVEPMERTRDVLTGTSQTIPHAVSKSTGFAQSGSGPRFERIRRRCACRLDDHPHPLTDFAGGVCLVLPSVGSKPITIVQSSGSLKVHWRYTSGHGTALFWPFCDRKCTPGTLAVHKPERRMLNIPLLPRRLWASNRSSSLWVANVVL